MRQSIKGLVKASFLVLVAPVYLLFRILCITSKTDRTFMSFSQALSLIPGKLGNYFRAAFYHMACPGTSDDVSIGFLTVFSHQNTTICKGVYIGPQCNIGMCEIGENTLLGSGVHILSGSQQHDFSNLEVPIRDQGGKFTKIVVGADCWIGNGSLVMESVADQSIIAAGTVLTRKFKAGDVVAGNPGKVLKNRFISTPKQQDH
jgi:virginiamycin A acetyltransferase